MRDRTFSRFLDLYSLNASRSLHNETHPHLYKKEDHVLIVGICVLG